MCPPPHFSECALQFSSSRIKHFHTITLLDDDGGSTEHSAGVSFHDTAEFFSTTWIIFTLSFIVDFFLFNAMAIHYSKITSKKIMALKCNTKKTLPVYMRDKQRMSREPCCLLQISKMSVLLTQISKLTELPLPQCMLCKWWPWTTQGLATGELEHAKTNPFNTKMRPKTCTKEIIY
jgi:hypothetical protein